MKNQLLTFCLFSILFSIKFQAQTCSSFIIRQYTNIINHVNFTDNSVPPANWQREYTHWNFNDGSSNDTGLTVGHTFPLAQSYNVYKETKFSEIGNPTNFCLATNSLVIDASISNPTSVYCASSKFKVKWLTGLTFGVSSYYSGCPYLFKEIVVDTGYYSSISSTGDSIPGIFATNQDFFTYTLPAPPYVYAFIYHVNSPDPNNSNGFTPGAIFFTVDSIPPTPLDCHASFFMLPTDSTLHNWTIQDFSSSSDSLSYFWDFGDGTTSTVSSPTHSYVTTGMYTVCLTVSNSTCSNTYCSSPLIDTTLSGHGVTTLNVQKMLFTSLAEKTITKSLISVFPNPAKDELTISYPFKNENYIIQITNTLGQTTLNKTMEGISNSNLNLNINELNSGVYFVQIKNSAGEPLSKTKFIKQ